MLKNITRLEHVIGKRIYHLTCDSDSPLSEVKDAIFAFTKYVAQVEDNFKAAKEAQENAEKSKDIPQEQQVSN